MAKQIARHDLIEDKLYIFKQDNSERWYARFVLFNKWYCKSTKKKDKEEAAAMAHRILLDHEIRIETNTLVQSKRFRYVAERVIAKLERELDVTSPRKLTKTAANTLSDFTSVSATTDAAEIKVRHDYSLALRKYHIPYFDRTYVTSIDQDAIKQFDLWREDQFGRKPASSTLKTHNAALNLVFKEAIENKWMIPIQVPVLSSKGESGTRRAAFSEEEYDAVVDGIYESEQNAHTEKTRQIRELLYDYCEIAVNTGIRPGTEMESITWGDIELKTQGSKAQFFINVRKGKTTKHTGTRKIVCKKDVIGAIARLRDRFPLRVPSQPLFLLANGESTPQLGKAFEKVLQKLNLKESPQGPRTLYSLRHTYITWQLLAGTSMDVIAKQCGTSVAMIEQHYSHVKPEMFADALSGVTFKTKQPKPLSKKATEYQINVSKRDEKRFKEWAAEFKTRGCI